MTLKHFACLMGLCGALVATSAYAQNREAGDVYLGAALGYNMAPDVEDEIQQLFDTEFGQGVVSASVDDGVLGWGAYGGYFFTDSLALELGYLDNADMDVSLRVVGTEIATVDVSTSLLYFGALAYIPMSDEAAVFPFFKGGLFRWESELSYSDILGTTISDDDDGVDPFVGAGVDVPVGDKVSIRGEYMMLIVDDDDGGNHHRFQVGVNFGF